MIPIQYGIGYDRDGYIATMTKTNTFLQTGAGTNRSFEPWMHLVQHLIEKCLIFHMSKEECMEALSKHANIEPVITSTVWNELEKENKEFFEGYNTQTQTKDDRLSEAETDELIQKMISDSTSKDHRSSSKDPADSSKDPDT
ncbi:hypothetical protein CK203_010345 [Vitis vinifera]|uniref:Uncharacterized protein n=1 Tax=Vitis vinifera TaxID=29760 RepID=A0A438JXQ0_VITVI|nr:hypothetical protein CK203_010345 [Vitis vinifera]